MTRPTVVCVCPVRDEGWILDQFLRCAGSWADHIVIADQRSTDDSRDIIRRHPKAVLVDNPSEGFDEPYMRGLLLDAARSFAGPRVIVSLDADEVLSSDLFTDPEWDRALSMPPGTALRFARIDLSPDRRRYLFHSERDGSYTQPLGFVDDGAPYRGDVIHGFRLPVAKDGPVFRLRNVLMLHYQFCEPARTASKHRWYRCFERLKFPDKSLVAVHRYYDWMDRIPKRSRPCEPGWFAGYESRGLDPWSFRVTGDYWWDWEVLRLFAAHGAEAFAGLDIWDPDWESLRQKGLARGIEGMPTTPVVPPKGRRKAFALGALKRTARLPLPVRMVTDKLLDWLVV